MSRQSGEEKPAKSELVNQLHNLEKMVEIRTAELKQANERLIIETTEREREKTELAAEKERLSVTLNLIADGVIAIDNEGNVTHMNHIAEDMTGCSQEAAMGQPFAEVLQLFDKKTQLPLEISFKQVQDDYSDMRTPHFAEIRTAPGIDNTVLFKVAPIIESGSKILGAVVILNDLTELKKMEETIIHDGQLDLLTDVVLARVQVEFIPDCWMAEVSKTFPDVIFKIESSIHLTTSDMNFTIASISERLVYFKSQDWESIVSMIENHPTVLSMHKWEAQENRALLNVKSEDSFLVRALLQSECILKYPVIFQDGKGTWELLSPRNRVDYLLSLLERHKIQFRLQSIETFSDKDNPVSLTKRQEMVRELALKYGFYDIPRRISLTELAKKLKIATSTLSGILRRISRTLVSNE